MAKPLQTLLVRAPSFEGLNTESSPLGQDLNFALSADNAVIDRLGRLGSRLAFATDTTTINVTYTTDPLTVQTDKEVTQIGGGDINGTFVILCIVKVTQQDADNNIIQTDYFVCRRDGDTLTEMTLPAGVPSMPAVGRGDIVYFNDKIYVFSNGNPALIYDNSGNALTKMNDEVNYLPPQTDAGNIANDIDADIALGAYGRLWVTGVGGDYQTIHYSDLLIANQWYDGKATPTDAQNTGGLINVSEYWPNGGDRIVALAAHNNFLVVFGRESILVYANAASGDPAAADGIFLQDTMRNLGCVGRDAIVNTGSDVLFVDDSGVRSLGRTIQEKSVPIGDLTLNVRGDIRRVIAEADQERIALSYWPEQSVIVCLFPDTAQAFVLATGAPSSTGGHKVTKWNRCFFNKMFYYENQGTTGIYLAGNTNDNGLLTYAGYTEWNDKPFVFKYSSMPLDFGSPANDKFLKSIDYTIFSLFEETNATARWGYDGNLSRKKSIDIDALIPAYFNEATFGDTTFGASGSTIRRYRVNTRGSGDHVRIGLDVKIKGNEVSVQEINVQTLLGRIN